MSKFNLGRGLLLLIMCMIITLTSSQAIEVKAATIANDAVNDPISLNTVQTGNTTISEYLNSSNITLLYSAKLAGTSNVLSSSPTDMACVVLNDNSTSGYFYIVRFKYSILDTNQSLEDHINSDSKITSICKIDGTSTENLKWLRALKMTGGKGYSTDALGSYTVGSGNSYSLGYSSKDQYQYDSILSILDQRRGTTSAGVTKYTTKDLAILEGTLRTYCDNLDTSKLSTMGSGSPGQNMKWLYTKDSDLSYISIVTTTEGFTIVPTVDGKNTSTLNEFSSILGNLSTNGQDLTKYTYLKKIVESYSTISQKLGKAKVDANNTAASTSSSSISQSSFDKMPAIEKWMTVIKTYVSSKGVATHVTPNTINTYNISKFKTWTTDANNIGEDKVFNSRDKLNNEEILRVKTYFYLTVTKTGNAVNWVDGFDLPTNGYKNLQLNQTGYENTDVKARADDVIAKTKASSTTTSTVSNVALNFELVSKYLAAKAYGFTEGNPFVVEDEQNASILETSTFIQSVTPALSADAGLLSYDYVLPKTSKLLYLDGSETAYEGYEQIQYALMLIATYANSNVVDKTTAGLYTNKVLDDFLAANANNPLNADITDELKGLIVSFTQIHKGLEYLGIKPFTDQLKVIDAYYNTLLTYSENTELKAYDPSDISDEPMRGFFSLKDADLNYYYKLGIVLSASYIPMQTNVYDTNSLQELADFEFVPKFHYAYGFYRKALYIDTNINSAVDYYISGKKGTRRVATLNDLLQPERDVSLYLDTNFYNVDKLAEMQGYTYTNLANTEEAGDTGSSLPWYDRLADTWSNWFDTNIENITKTGEETTYSSTIKRKVSAYGDDKEKGTQYVLSDSSIDKYLTSYSDDAEMDVYDEYTPLQAFAVVSSIYRDSKLYNIVTDENRKQKPVFISSPTLASVKGVGVEQWNTIYNYIMLKNLKESLGVDYKTTLDLDNPIYMDIYGNIVTESGLVVIPAASNSTLYKASSYTVYNAGFLSLYNNAYHLPVKYNNSDKFMSNMFTSNEELGTWELSNKAIGGLYVNFKDVPLTDKDLMQTMIELMQQSLNNKAIDFNNRVWMMTEVLRGAPIENINKEFEGLKGNRAINKYGIYIAYKIDELASQLLSNSNGNSLVSLPNLAHMDYVEYVVLFLFKIIFAVMMVLIAYNIYVDSTQSTLGIRSIVRGIATLICFVAFVYLVPKLLDFSYYQTNKQLLQSEVEQIELLNLEKKSAGKEIGVYEVTEPETQTELYLKVDSLSVPWYQALPLIINSSTFATMDDIYGQAFENNLMAGLDDIIKKANGLYINVDNMLASTAIEYSDTDKILYNHTLATPYVSYCTPYYVILDQLVARINEYNVENNITSTPTKIQNNGETKTTGLLKAYFSSNYFMEDSQDVLGFKAIHNIEVPLVESSAFSEEQINSMVNSMWYLSYVGKDEEQRISSKLDALDNAARAFVVDHYSLLGKVTDETFLKVMALSLSIKYNQKFRIPACSSIELFNIDTRDIMRLSIAKNSTVLEDSSKSFARFTYDNAGTLGVVAVAFLIVIYFVSSLIKPIAMIVILGCVLTSLIIRRLIKRDKNKSIEGFITTIALLCLTNVVYALNLKGSMLLPNMGFKPVVCALLQIILQIVYMITLVALTVWVMKDWANLGWARYEQMGHSIMTTSFSNALNSLETFKVNRNPNAKEIFNTNYTDNKRSTRGITGQDVLQQMRERDERREKEYEESQER